MIRSNDGDAKLQHRLHGRDDRRTRLQRALATPYVSDQDDFILIDTQRAIGPMQTAATFAAENRSYDRLGMPRQGASNKPSAA